MWIGIGGIVSSTAGPLVIGSLWKRANKTSAIISLLVGTAAYWILYLPFGFDISNPFAAAGLGVIISMVTMIISVLITTKRSEEHTSELQSRFDLVCRLLLEKK